MSVEKQNNLLGEFQIPSYDEWREAAVAALKGVPFEKKMYTKTYEEITLEPIYNPSDRDGLDHISNDLPGTYPFVRSTTAAGYVGKAWEVSQEIPYPTPEEFNKAACYDLGRGQDALNIKLNKASSKINGNSVKKGNAAYQGLYLSTVKDMEKAFNNIDLTQVPVYINANTEALSVAAQFAAYCRKNNIDLDKVSGGIEFDIIGELVEEGRLNGDIDGFYRELAQLTEWVGENAPKLNTVTANGSVFQNAGANLVQELAFAIASATENLREMIKRGVDVNVAAASIRFKLSIGSNFFMEIAKFRAIRMLWAKIVKEFGGEEEAQKAFVHAESTTMNKTKYDPNVNMLRTTTEAFSAVVGGCDSMHLAYYDDAFGMPNDFSRRVSRNIQSVFRDETHLTEMADPAGGSYYVEVITDSLAKKAWELFQSIEVEGGMVASLKAGTPQKAIAEVVANRKKNVETRKDVILGTNKYANLADGEITSAKKYGEEVFNERIKAFSEFCNNRDNEKVYSLLKEMTEMAKKEDSNCFDTAICAAANGASSSELVNIFSNERAGEITIDAIPEFRTAALYEELRDVANAYKEANGELPKVYLANFGAVRDWKGRSDFSLDFFQVGGFEAVNSEGFTNPEDAVKAFVGQNIPVLVICSSDDKYPEFVPEFTQLVKKAKPETKVVVAGYPKDYIDQFKAAGVDEFIHVRANNYQILANLQKETGIRK